MTGTVPRRRLDTRPNAGRVRVPLGNNLSRPSSPISHPSPVKMETEKPLLTKEEAEGTSSGLPPPNTARPDLQCRLQITRRVILFSLVTFLALWHIRALVTNQLSADTNIVDVGDPVSEYLSGVVGKGMRKALCGSKGHFHAEKHHKHHADKHKHHGAHGKEGRAMKMIPPKMAEKIFLSVPNNESCRA